MLQDTGTVDKQGLFDLGLPLNSLNHGEVDIQIPSAPSQVTATKHLTTEQDVASAGNSSKEPSVCSSSPYPSSSDSGIPTQLQSPKDELRVEAQDQGDVDSDEDDYRRWKINSERPRKISEKKRSDYAKFQSWLQSKGADALMPANKSSAEISHASITYLVKEKENQRIIQSPREYQMELFERAKQKNIIAVLETGSGKTLIAALLLRHILEKEIENRESGMPKRIAFFLVDKVSLVFQQHAVLESNLEHPVARFCGDMVENMWSGDFWSQQFQENKVIVCTAAILHKCLLHSYIRIDQINLLIFDEAHHTKKNHPYARIIKDFYIKEPNKSKRPRVLGMTASPVDAQTDVKLAANHLEALLHSEIATVSEELLSKRSRTRMITETEIHYHNLPQPFKTELYEKISKVVGQNEHFRRELSFSHEATSSLGPWIADRFWKIFLTDDAILRLSHKTDISYSSIECDERATTSVRMLLDVIQAHKFKPALSTEDHLSKKTIRLWQELKDRFSNPTDHRCIVFVDMRLTAVMLTDLFKQDGIRLPHLKPAALIGSQSAAGAARMSFKEQILTMTKFRRGEVNCIFATQVAEEGIDIPDCNLVIRFDLYKSVIQYIQSKGRARRENSEYISFIEGGNGKHSRTLAQAQYDQSVLRRFCSAMPEDRKIMGFDINASVLQGEAQYKSYVIQESGAKLTWMSSLEVLASFVSSLAQSTDEMLAPEYFVTNQGKTFVAEVQLPAKSPIQSMSGMPQRNKQAARCSAAFEMCKELIKKKFIDKNLIPIFTKKLPAMRNARLAVSANKKVGYNMRTKPELWSRLGPTDLLFVTALVLRNPDAIGRLSKPLLLLTRERLPELPPVPLFFGSNKHADGKDKQSEALAVALPAPIQISHNDLEILKVFTFRIFKDVFSKEYEAPASDLPYFLAPTLEAHSTKFRDIKDAATVIDWDHLRVTKEKDYVAWDDKYPDEFFKDKLVVDPYAGSRKLYLRGVRRDMKLTDPVPEGVPDPGHRPWRDPTVEKNIKEYSVSLWMKARNRPWRESQPVVEAEVVSLRRNLLDDFTEPDAEGSKVCYVILEPLRISTLPIDTVAIAFTFPAIIHRLDSVMIALDACKLLNLNIRPDLALEAVTKDSDNSDEHDEEKLNLQAGMGKNYERLEFLGDCFLKMATTIAIFTAHPDSSEFEYHVERMLLLCNQNLFNKAVDRNLQEYIRSRQFDRRSWYPQGLKLRRGKQGVLHDKHLLADKSIADVCEAFIGAAYLNYADTTDFDMAVRAVTAVVKDKRHLMTSWGDYYAAYNPPVWQFGKTSAMQRELTRQIKETMGYEFKSPALLRSAFKHPSYPRAYENLPNYQRLEFLGDSLLDMVSVDFLFNRFPDADPQWLTEHKMAMVSNQFLATLCVQLGFHKHILSGNSTVVNQTHEFVESLKLAKDEAQATDRFSQNYWTAVKHSPKHLADVLEAYVGAVFVDSGYNYNKVREFFNEHIRPFFTDMALYDSFASGHPVRGLADILKEFGCMECRLVIMETPLSAAAGVGAITRSEVFCALMIHGGPEPKFVAKAASGRYAKIASAKAAIAEFSGLDKAAFKVKYGCKCQAISDEIELESLATAV
ncbi:Dicer-like protein 1 [Colletotrichum chlorophyti]|uniref:Dicer-like protein 1 n=1 Tax=Colletotrichum chlorophyti TaxID=708187 RepID=A0A1Q8S7C5_9PEZI|nr:Dicer-like protein 1 [Colletotrichum chlorophyti]